MPDEITVDHDDKNLVHSPADRGKPHDKLARVLVAGGFIARTALRPFGP